jgi:predicted acyltransferase
MSTASSQAQRLASLDQFRGYTVAGMFLVNFIGSYTMVHDLLRHHNTYCSYADTIMPQFFFAVGFAFRLTYLRRIERDGVRAAVKHAVWRNISLLVIGLILYGITTGKHYSWDEIREMGFAGYLQSRFTWTYIQTLVHIAITSFWILPVIGASTRVQAIFLACSGLAHVLISYFWYYDWIHTVRIIDGGPLGFMTWTIPTLTGSIAYDVMATRGPRGSVKPFAVWSVVLMAAGYVFACFNAVHNRMLGDPLATGIRAWLVNPPFVPPPAGWTFDIWTMSQRAGSVSYLTFSAGFSLAVLLFFIWFSDLKGIEIGVFRTLGQNALAGYILHGMTGEAIKPLVPENAPAILATANFLLFFWLTYIVMRFLEKRKLYLRL